MENELPERINVMRVVTYDVAKILEDAGDAFFEGDKDLKSFTVDDLLEWIAPWVAEDFGSTHGLIYQDQDGNEL